MLLTIRTEPSPKQELHARGMKGGHAIGIGDYLIVRQMRAAMPQHERRGAATVRHIGKKVQIILRLPL